MERLIGTASLLILVYPADSCLCITNPMTSPEMIKANATPPTINPIAAPVIPHLPPFFKLPPLRLHFHNEVEHEQSFVEVVTMWQLVTQTNRENRKFTHLPQNEVLHLWTRIKRAFNARSTYLKWHNRQNRFWRIHADKEFQHIQLQVECRPLYISTSNCGWYHNQCTFAHTGNYNYVQLPPSKSTGRCTKRRSFWTDG